MESSCSIEGRISVWRSCWVEGCLELLGGNCDSDRLVVGAVGSLGGNAGLENS